MIDSTHRKQKNQTKAINGKANDPGIISSSFVDNIECQHKKDKGTSEV